MNIQYTTIRELKDILTLLKSLNIPNCKILDNMIRGKSDDISTSVITPTTSFNFNIGISSCALLLSRLNAFDESASYEAELDNENNIKTITIKKGRVKSVYTAASPSRIKAPKAILFDELASFTLTTEDVNLIRTTAPTVTEQYVHIKSDGTSITWFNGDASNETVSIETLNPTTTSPFAYQYDMKPILNVLRLAGDDHITIVISDRGFMKIDVAGLTTISLPYTSIGR